MLRLSEQRKGGRKWVLEIDVFNGFADTAFDDYLWLCLFPKGS